MSVKKTSQLALMPIPCHSKDVLMPQGASKFVGVIGDTGIVVLPRLVVRFLLGAHCIARSNPLFRPLGKRLPCETRKLSGVFPLLAPVASRGQRIEASPSIGRSAKTVGSSPDERQLTHLPLRDTISWSWFATLSNTGRTRFSRSSMIFDVPWKFYK